MSADDWTTCPKCTEKRGQEWRHAERQAADQYGKVTPEEFTKLMEEVHQKRALAEGDQPETLREDYELGIVKGNFWVTYRASCTVCGFTYEFKKEDEPV